MNTLRRLGNGVRESTDSPLRMVQPAAPVPDFPLTHFDNGWVRKQWMASPPSRSTLEETHSQNLVFAVSLLGMALLLFFDVMTSREIRLHILYVLPLAAIALNCDGKAKVVLAAAVATAFQVATFWIYGLSAASLATDTLVAAIATTLIVLMGVRIRRQRRRLIEEAEAKLQALDQVRHQDRLATVGRLAAGIAHELGTPLNVVSGRAKMIEGDERALRNAQIIGEQADRMAQIVRQLLDFARRKEPLRASADLRQLTHQTIELLTPIARKNQVRLRIEAADNFPQLVRLDSLAVQQALSNLMVNGIQAMPNGGDLVVRLSREHSAPPDAADRRPRAFACIRVSDTGKGIPPDALTRVFEPFFSTKEVGEGTGLGLTVVHGIVADHGGFVTVDSEVGRGTTFGMFIPVDSTSEQARPV